MDGGWSYSPASAGSRYIKLDNQVLVPVYCRVLGKNYLNLVRAVEATPGHELAHQPPANLFVRERYWVKCVTHLPSDAFAN